MKHYFTLFLIVSFFIANLFGTVFVYPFFSNLGSITVGQQQNINDFNEKEEELTEVAPTINVVNLDWFEVVNTFFEKYKTTRVIDVKTKKQYYVKRTGGYNHADVEPIDETNMKIFKSIYGGTYSWTRRPAWVEINGVFVAASINGMPHGYTLIDNGQDGHTCIHFLNSKTHGTKRVDEAHQEAISQAFNRQSEINLLNLR